MATKSNGASDLLEVEKLPRPGDRADRGVKKVHLMPETSLEAAKAHVGEVVKAAIGDNPRKVYGPDNTISGVISGEKVADWLARIYVDHGARKRFAREWMRGSSGVRQRNLTVIEWDEEVAV
jgi:hypothetical protein